MLTVMGDEVYFVIATTPGPEELWKSDGTLGGTERLARLDTAPNRSVIERLVPVDGTLYFWASTATRGQEIWVSDGTSAGTRPLQPTAWRELTKPSAVAVGDALYHVVSPTDAPPQLWKRTREGSTRVRDFGPSASTPAPTQLTAMGEQLLFWASDEAGGFEPWRSDGTEAGTVRLKDIAPGPTHAVMSPGPFFPLKPQGPWVFAASDGASGLEPWTTDGTETGTRRVADIAPGPLSSSPRALAVAGSKVYFTAWHPASGRELWAWEFETPDREPPQLTCPAGQVAEAPSGQGASVTYPPASVSDLDPAPVVHYSHASGDRFPLGDTQVRVTATDWRGNSADCVFVVQVRDTRAPELTCPPSVSAIAESAEGVYAGWPEARAQDAVSTPVVTYEPPRGTRFPLGTTPVRVTATDASGNSTSCAFDVRVKPLPTGEEEPPTSPEPETPEQSGSSGCGCQQSSGAGAGLLGLALVALLSTRRRQSLSRGP